MSQTISTVLKIGTNGIVDAFLIHMSICTLSHCDRKLQNPLTLRKMYIKKYAYLFGVDFG